MKITGRKGMNEYPSSPSWKVYSPTFAMTAFLKCSVSRLINLESNIKPSNGSNKGLRKVGSSRWI
jgi:hypothetical protein